MVEFRNTNGPFICREQLLSVKGLGEKSYEQAAGFIRVHYHGGSGEAEGGKAGEGPSTNKKAKTAAKSTAAKKKKQVTDFQPNLLDMTWIHPESYDVTYR